jgi:predicted nucleic acid-binding protein
MISARDSVRVRTRTGSLADCGSGPEVYTGHTRKVCRTCMSRVRTNIAKHARRSCTERHTKRHASSRRRVILAHTSAWVEYDRAPGSTVDQRVAELIDADGSLMVTEPIVMKVLAGARDYARVNDLRRLLLRAGLLPFDATTDFAAATRIYGRCRRSGITPRGMIDCMIAAVAWRQGAPLLCRDADLNGVAHVIGIDLDQASARA